MDGWRNDRSLSMPKIDTPPFLFGVMGTSFALGQTISKLHCIAGSYLFQWHMALTPHECLERRWSIHRVAWMAFAVHEPKVVPVAETCIALTRVSVQPMRDAMTTHPSMRVHHRESSPDSLHQVPDHRRSHNGPIGWHR